MIELAAATLAKIAFLLAVILGLVPVLIWAERKGSAFIQDRTGPNRASVAGIRLGGLVHPIADVLKLLFKEDVRPAQVHGGLYALAPFLVFFVSLLTYAVLPFGDYLQVGDQRFPLVVADLDVGILYILAIASLGTYGVVMGGWASNNKYTFLGALRSSSQMISYEISMGLAIMGLILISGSLRLTEIVADQGRLLWGFLPAWGVVVQPLGAVLFITAVFAETNRNPFDLPEGESELVSGYHLEYSSMKFALFFMAEYTNMVIASAMITTLFFGGWNIPWLSREVIEANAGVVVPAVMVLKIAVLGAASLLLLRRAAREKGKFGDARDREPGLLGVIFGVLALLVAAGFALKPWAIGPQAASVAATLLQVGAFVGKVVFFCWFFIWVRWTLPRFRYDQLMGLGWKVMLPLALVNLVITAVWLAVF
ncbi:MAG TPA: NADH-quinone oxidoreductase subunit H [Candidatus Krumholzibacteria bacterium]|nr:NADH-quinone oxidoreductase subunit H [Candidatus Krumholzibacteria bacterium]HRX50401.1 NADH-quinone oxidoreductase subunit H [Candidatus Krumholzibacteria bacterium]